MLLRTAHLEDADPLSCMTPKSVLGRRDQCWRLRFAAWDSPCNNYTC